MDTESEPFEDPIETKTPESPLTVAPPTLLLESTPPTLVPILRRTAHMVVRVPPAMSSGLSSSMAEVAAMSESAFRKRFRSSYKSFAVFVTARPFFTKALLRTQRTGVLLQRMRMLSQDEGLTARDEGPGMGVESCGLDDESRGLDDEGHSVESDGLGLGEDEEAVPEGQQQAVPVVGRGNHVTVHNVIVRSL
ncbi:hypothetical protein Tco_0091123 [Tanacetum coccineum]